MMLGPFFVIFVLIIEDTVIKYFALHPIAGDQAILWRSEEEG